MKNNQIIYREDSGLKYFKINEKEEYIIGKNDLLQEKHLKMRDEAKITGIAPRYNVEPILNENRSYGIQILDGLFCIATAETLVERLLKQ